MRRRKASWSVLARDQWRRLAVTNDGHRVLLLNIIMRVMIFLSALENADFSVLVRKVAKTKIFSRQTF